jgi:LemA protein
MLLTIILLILAVVLITWLAWTWNRLVALRAAMQAAWASVDALLKRRTDLIPNLVALVKGTMNYEADTLTRIVEARGSALGAHSVAERSAAERDVTHGVRQLLALVEQYPELRANENVLRLQHQLTETEDDIASARRYYNAVVRDLNIMRETFPNVLVASMLGFREGEYFKVDDDERSVPGTELP